MYHTVFVVSSVYRFKNVRFLDFQNCKNKLLVIYTLIQVSFTICGISSGKQRTQLEVNNEFEHV